MEQKDPCDYKFQMISVAGRNYRVPVLSQNVGKVIEHSAIAPAQRSEFPGRREEKKKKVNYTHFLSVPIDAPSIKASYAELKQKVSSADIKGVTESCWQAQAQHHITILMLDLSDPLKLEMAKRVLEDLDREIQTDILDATGGSDPKPIHLTFRGLRTFQNNLKEARIVYCDLEKDENYNLLVKISSLLIK